jgi:hypothetical protein
MHVADCIELYLAHHEMPRARLNAAWTTQLEQSQEGSLNAYGTSEGAEDGWDTRGRGRKTMETAQYRGYRVAGRQVKSNDPNVKMRAGNRQTLKVNDDGSWFHTHPDHGNASGDNAGDLRTHLDDIDVLDRQQEDRLDRGSR